VLFFHSKTINQTMVCSVSDSYHPHSHLDCNFTSEFRKAVDEFHQQLDNKVLVISIDTHMIGAERVCRFIFLAMAFTFLSFNQDQSCPSHH
jgi:hypothetical protein